MTLLYYDRKVLDHDTGEHPERPARLEQVARQLQRTGLDQQCQRPTWAPATTEQLSRNHTAEYIAELQAAAQRGGGRIEADTVMSRESFDVACLAAGAACDAVSRVLTDEDSSALCLIRPPGHHALRDQAMGFCLLNNVAVAAHHALAEFELERVLIVDWDVHHGNGTQASFWEDGRVGSFSIHRSPFYPGTGQRDDTGHGRGLGTTCNVPLPETTAREVYLEAFRNDLQKFADKIRPQLVLISAGFDAHHADPVGGLGLELEDFTAMTETVQAVAATHAGHRIVSLLEGGYNPGILAGCVELHLQQLLKAPGPRK